jgi:hypothetical protein
MTDLKPAKSGRVKVDDISGAAHGYLRQSPEKAHPPILDFLRRH